MIQVVDHKMKPIELYMLTAIFLFFASRPKNRNLSFIMFISGINIIYTYVLIKSNPKANIMFNTNIYFILNNFLWFQIILEYFKSRTKRVINLCFIIITIVFLSIQGIKTTVYYDFFIVTAIGYVVLFFITSIKKLKEEQLGFFNSIDYILAFAPVLFFLAMSFIFGFKSRIFSDNTTSLDITYYELINGIANVIYYGLITYCAFKARKSLWKI